MSNRIWCLMGPTASGKTAAACALVERFPFEIVSVDSALIYRGMTIGTAKPDKALLARAPHHLIDICDPHERYSAAAFCADVQVVCQQIYARGNQPLLTGGTMMYFRALQAGLSSLPASDESIRAQLADEAAQHGWSFLHQRLMQVDPVAASRIHAHDTQRIQRALEIYTLTGQPMSQGLSVAKEATPYEFMNLMVLPIDRSWLHERIAMRFQQMLADGLVAEVEGLMARYPLTDANPSMRSVGYRQVWAYLHGEYDASQLLEKGIVATRQLAKRQLTWLRHWPAGHVFAAENEQLVDAITAVIQADNRLGRAS